MGENIKITVVEDDKSLVKVIKRFLERQNFTVSFAYGGIKGLEVIRKEKPDLVLLDIMMPDMNGKEVLAELKKDNETKNIPVIIFTGKSEQTERLDALELGAYEYVTKPYDSYLLLRQINNILEKKQKGEI